MSAHSCVVSAHAKVNLLLHILEREASGYHGIETLFQRLALHDIVHVDVGTSARELLCDGPAMPAAGLGEALENLAWRAASAYASTAGWDTGWRISIEKHIPVGGGLGGGSADAAAVLRALESLAPTPIGEARLLAIAGSLGADVPFLLSGENLAWAWARGDHLLALPRLPVVPVTLVAFTEGINTGAAYAAFAANRAAIRAARMTSGAETTTSRVYETQAFASWPSVRALAANDFESVATTMHAGVAETLPIVRAAAGRTGGIGLMSGSGATCFFTGHDGEFSAATLPDGARVFHTTTA